MKKMYEIIYWSATVVKTFLNVEEEYNYNIRHYTEQLD